MKDSRQYVVLDIESRNHLQKDCKGDPSKLKIGLVGIKYLTKIDFQFFDETILHHLERILLNADLIVGYNLVGHNGLDYAMLENYGIRTELLKSKTNVIKTTLIRTFGSYREMSLDNLARQTLGIPKKKSKRANYKLIQNGQIDKVKSNLKYELEIIEKLFLKILDEELISFKTSLGFEDEHELPSLAGFHPELGEESSDPYDFPVGGMRLQIKDRFDEALNCEGCGKLWRIRSICYYGDTLRSDVSCPECKSFIVTVRTSVFGKGIQILAER